MRLVNTGARRRVRRRARRGAAAGLAATLAAFTGLTVVAVPPASAGPLLSETFAGTRTPSGVWTMVSPKGAHTPCLTAATKMVEGSLPACNDVLSARRKADAAGKGAYQLTDSSKQDAGGVVLNEPIDSTAGLHLEFDQFQYKTTTKRGADGISFFLIDGASEKNDIGDSGGWLGYRNLDDAFVGVGFDQYGNFSNPKIWGKGDKGPGAKPNSVVVRGSEASHFQYVKGVPSPGPLGVDKATSRDKARRTVSIDLSTAGFMNVGIDFHDGKGSQRVLSAINLNKIEGQGSLPSKIKLGFAASTGDSTNVHEIQNFKATTLDPDLSVALSPVKGGKATATVSNAPAAGPTNGPVTVDVPVPPGMKVTDVAGDGWSCKPADTKVTCTRPGTGKDQLKPGAAYPPIDLTFQATGDKETTGPVTATVGTPGDSNPGNNTSPPVNITAPAGENPLPKGPDLSTVVTPGDNEITATVSNREGAAPTTGPTTVDVPIPSGVKVTSVTGEGWKCTTGTTKVSCVRADPLQPGDAFQPVIVGLESATGKPVTVPVKATATTPGDTDPSNNTSEPTDLTVAPPAAKGPDLSMALTPHGDQVTAVVSNAPTAGATDNTVTAKVTLPNGAKVTSASGQGWECGITGDTAVCTRSGTGDDALQPGASYPPVTVVGESANGTPVSGKAEGSTATPNDVDNGNDTAKPVDLTFPGLPPNLNVKLDGQGNFVPGGTGTVTATVSNADNAGPTDKQVSVTVPVPAGMTVVGTTGQGWACKTGQDAVTCVRPGTGADALKPGASYPPVTVKLKGDANMPGTTRATASVTTPDEGDPSDNTAPPLTLPKPGLQVEMAINPNPYQPGGHLTYTIKVTNSGPDTVTDAQVGAAVAQVWKDVPWTCKATAGSSCPGEKGKGDIDATVTVGPGGSVVFTADCVLPAGVKVPLKGSATVTAASDANCAGGCTVEATALPGAELTVHEPTLEIEETPTDEATPGDDPALTPVDEPTPGERRP
ncbi:hypothetical protein J4573_33130 [Actinomadura barringtoniae]|uniref:DUF11 domain-containing protein n=1 Tax=Actinomadura barringtoniae TaxID=1427535 RepID=A0A939T409_9ACTN|nr:hypothetical protein [Actinomadura barringtoniae]MBO2451971.1 hypothetical protein [Actinomadura barringtoniae]